MSNSIKRFLLITLIFSMLETFAMATNNRHDLFFINKSENKNQVHYAIILNDKCFPEGVAPIYPYWLMLERGPNITEGLLGREQGAYGIHSQKVISNSVELILNALPNKKIKVSSSLENGKCSLETITFINNKEAILKSVHVELGFLRVKSITIHGLRLDNGSNIEEKIKE
jgi:Domain of unknown function (DUF4833)